MSDTIPETVARVLDLDERGTAKRLRGLLGNAFCCDDDCRILDMTDDECPRCELVLAAVGGLEELLDTADAAPALAREVERLEKVADNLQREFRDAEQLVCDERELLLVMKADRDTARAECERLRAGLFETLGFVYAKPEDISVERFAALCALAEVPK